MRILLVVAALFCCVSHAAPASLKWYKPFHLVPPGSNMAQVTIFGKTSAKASVSIDPAQVVTANPINDAKSAADTAAIISTISENSGNFKLNLHLPMGFVQIPLTITGDGGEKNTYIITLQIESDKTEISAKTENDEKAVAEWREKLREYAEVKYGRGQSMNSKLKGLNFRLGAGLNYQIHSQTLSSGTKLNFNSAKFPSLSLQVNYATERWLYNISTRRTPGSAKGSTAPFTLDKSDYVWTTTVFEAGYISQQKVWRDKARLAFLFGLQQHFTPLFRPTFGNIIDLQTVQMNTLSVGPLLSVQIAKNYIFETSLRYQYPFEAHSLDESGFSVKPKLLFDGSLGVIYAPPGRHHFGLVWLGQWHNYNFSFVNDADATTRSGQESLFYTNLDFVYSFHF